MSQIDSFLLTNANPFAHRYTIKVDGFDEIKPRLVTRFLLAGLIPVLVILAVFLYTIGLEAGLQVLAIIMTIVCATVAYSVYSAFKRQRELFESFVLTIEDDAIVRVQHNLPEIRILKSDVRSMSMHKSGSLVIKGKGLQDSIAIPAQIDEREQLEAELRAIGPITPGVSGIPDQLVGFLTLAGVGLLIYLAFASDNKIVIGVSGALFLTAMAGAIFIISRSKHVDRRTRLAGYFVIIPMLSLGSAWYNRLTTGPLEDDLPEEKIEIRNGYFSPLDTIHTEAETLDGISPASNDSNNP